MPTYYLRPQAAADLEEIRLYISGDNLEAAARLLEQFRDTFRRLAEFPGLGRARPELGSELRSFPLGNYLIFYRPIDNGVDIGRVLHGSRDFEALPDL
ncbi:MAG: type II toxin-antitoxin system RelE/ParE family toxin [Dehalococcoidia bacterium]